MTLIELSTEPFNPWHYLATWQTQAALRPGHFGATAVFVGTMRDFNEGDDVIAMFLEHYPAMTQQHLTTLVDQAAERWQLDAALVVHRVGNILPSDPIVLVATWSAHRAAAFEACREIMESLKHSAPFWKRETLKDNSVRWVETNTAGYTQPIR